jgi:hypothetical protein
VVAGGVAGVHAARVEDGADQAGGVPEVGVGDTVVADLAAVGTVSPTIIRIVVDLPAPFGPTKPVTRPAATVKVRSSTAVRLP